jgi:hypothetical protein
MAQVEGGHNRAITNISAQHGLFEYRGKYGIFREIFTRTAFLAQKLILPN